MATTLREQPVGTLGSAPSSRRRVGVRLWLAFAFAVASLITAGSVYIFVSDRTVQALTEREAEIAIGRTARLADRIGSGPVRNAQSKVSSALGQGYSAWAFDDEGELQTGRVASGIPIESVPDAEEAVASALTGNRFASTDEGELTVAAAPVFRRGRLDGAVLALASRPPDLERSVEALQRDRLTTLGIAVFVAVLIGAVIASLITTRIKRLATSASEIAEGRLDMPVESRGRDEIGDLGRALDRMRRALRESFSVLSSERDRLSAIFAGLSDAVMVVSPEGDVRFSNPAADELIAPDGKPIQALRPWLRRAAHRGIATHDGLRVGERVYALNARHVAAENAVLAVVRDRTEELRREIAEREFVSNAAHELRNPIAGISGAIEVLQAGAKDDHEARDHFLRRLSEDADRVSRLTHSLLTLARMEAIGEGEAEIVDVGVAMREAVQAIPAPDGVRVHLDIDPDLAAQGDPVLLRQVLIGLLTNAFKNTPPPGTVTLRARRRDEGDAMIEVADTGSGIPGDEVDRVFERFYRGSGQLESEGFGLGLSIAKRMVDVMGGEIGVTSEVGVGSTFWVRLPAAQPTATPVA